MCEELIKGHVSYLTSIWEKGQLLFCGPCNDGTAVMILKTDSLESAESLVKNDPFSEVKYYQSIEFKEVQDANPSNNFHLEEVLTFLNSK